MSDEYWTKARSKGPRSEYLVSLPEIVLGVGILYVDPVLIYHQAIVMCAGLHSAFVQGDGGAGGGGDAWPLESRSLLAVNSPVKVAVHIQ
jgi:hypothetical protein